MQRGRARTAIASLFFVPPDKPESTSLTALMDAAGTLTPKADYRAEYTYDANGNILSLKRNADAAHANASGTGMDNLEYIYENIDNGYTRNTNKLKAVIDYTGTTPVEMSDLKPGQVYDPSHPETDNYQYDEIGNLIKDAQEGIASIEWTVYACLPTFL